jgi:hypothetical protein
VIRRWLWKRFVTPVLGEQRRFHGTDFTLTDITLQFGINEIPVLELRYAGTARRSMTIADLEEITNERT